MVIRGRVVTMDPRRPTAEAMAVSHGRVIAVGGLDAAVSAAGSSAAVLDVGEGTILPGFVDAHNHLLWTGLSTQLVDLSGARCIADVIATVRAWAHEHPGAPWVTAAEGWEMLGLAEQRYPTRDELNSACADRPVYLPRGGHDAATNTLALSLAGVDRDVADPPGGVVERDADGQPTGVLRERARDLVARHVPPLTAAQQAAAVIAVQPGYIASGITRVQEPGLRPEEMSLYQQVRAAGQLDVRVTMMPMVATGTPLPERLAHVAGLGVRSGFGDDRLSLGGLKLFLDGGGSMGTAFMREDWPGKPGYRGELLTSPEDLDQVVQFCVRQRWSLGVHAVGGAAVDLALDSFDRAQRNGGRVEELRFHLIHAYLDPSERNMSDARRLGVSVAAQPGMQERLAGRLEQRLDRRRAAGATPLRSWLDAGVLVAGSSDSPVVPYPPLRGLWQAVTRFSPHHGDVFGAEQRVTRQEALKMYTSDAAWLSFAENSSGMLREGMAADWVVLPADPLTCEDEELMELRPTITAIGGQLLYDVR
jgi:predicted amidohydrolase YtcJ